MRRIPLILAALLVLVAVSPTPRAEAAVDSGRFIQSVAPAAQRAHRATRVPASVSIAQSILESGWGGSVLARWGHAYFGIKCKPEISPYQLGCMDKSSLEYFDPQNPIAVVSAFRTYRSADDSFADHGDFLRTSTRYAAAFATTNPDDFIREVGRAGYATDPGYADQVIGIMQRYSLYRYDLAQIDDTPVAVDGAIGDRYRGMGGGASPLSWPIGGEQNGPIDGARLTPFNRGMITWSPATGAQPLLGAIWDHYRFDQRVRDGLRLPTSGEFCGLRDGGCFQRYAGGAMYWSPRSGTHTVWGTIADRWADQRWETGPLGYPTTDESCGLRDGGCWQGFQGGTIHWSPTSGAWITWGAVQDHWAANGWENGRYGYPVGPERCGTPGGVFQCTQAFRGGTIAFRADRGTF